MLSVATCRLANSPLLSQFKHKHRHTCAEGRVRTRAPVLSLFELKGRCEAAEAAEVQDAWYVLNSLFLAEVSLSWCCYILVWRGLSHTSQNKTRNTVTLNINPAISWSLIMLLQCKHENMRTLWYKRIGIFLSFCAWWFSLWYEDIISVVYHCVVYVTLKDMPWTM